MRYCLCLLLSMLFMSSCASLVHFETAKTNGKENLSMHLNVSGYGLDNQGQDGQYLPFGEIGMSYGVTEKLDVELSASSGFNGKISAKYQFAGDSLSAFASALEPGIEFQLTDAGEIGFRYHFPLHFSIHTDSQVSYFVSPKYVLQDINEISHFIGISTGLSYMRNVEYFIGAGMYQLANSTAVSPGTIIQFGGGIRIPL